MSEEKPSVRAAARVSRSSRPSDPKGPRRKKRGAPEKVGGLWQRLTSLRGRRLWLSIAGAIVLVPALGFVIAMTLFAWKKGPGDAPVEVVIPAHATAAEIARVLGDAELIQDRELMTIYLKAATAEDDVVPGKHLLVGGQTPAALRDLLTRSSTRPKRKVTFPEGWNRFQMAARLEEKGIVGKATFLDATSDAELLKSLGVPGPEGGAPESAEGYLAPITYDLQLDSTGDDLVRRFVGESRTRWDRLAERHASDLSALHGELSWDRREVVILASMVEKEAAVDDERSIIAGVFMNRLSFPSFTPKHLESDPTTAYGCFSARAAIPSCAHFDGKITGAMNRDKANRYSTYTNEGLPPGPICNPSDKALEAAMAPATTGFLFFVAKGGGRHAFSETLEEHNRAIHGDH